MATPKRKRNKKSIVVNFDSTKNIRSAEKKKRALENQGYKLTKTLRVGFNRFRLEYEEQ